ncbi:MAG: hypothetical protein OJJ55_19140 [Rhodococcus sp.]|nr:hypothetical protein [Rhodococcus sp. (in: high G+C Gram-positive bacteria)]
MAVPTVAESAQNFTTPLTALTTPVATTATLSGGTDQLYLSAVYIRDSADFRATSMSGGGLTWARLLHKRDTQVTLNFEWWWAFGSPGSAFSPQVDEWSLESGSDTSLAAAGLIVARIDGSLSTGPVNASGTDTGATDTSSASHTQTVSNANSLIMNALTTRAFTISTADADYTEQATGTSGSAGNVLRGYMHKRSSSPAAGTDTIAHTLSGAADWINAGIEVREASGGGGGPTLHLLSSTGVGV